MSSDGPYPAVSAGRPRPARVLALVVLVLFAALLAWGLLSESDDGVDATLAQGQAPLAPGFDLPLLRSGRLPTALRALIPVLADDRLTLSELDGQPLVLNIWASWCDPCRQEAPILERGWRRWGPRGVLFLGLDIQDVPEDARAFLSEYGITYPNLREPSNSVARAYGSTGLPETFFISSQGRVVSHVIGAVSDEQLDDGARAARRDQVVGTLAGGTRRQQR